MDIYAMYENYKIRCEDQDIEPMPLQEYIEGFEEDVFEAMRQDT